MIDCPIQKNNVETRNLWAARDTIRRSWVWRKLSKLQPLAAEFITMEVRSGTRTLLLSDKWLATGRLIVLTSDAGRCQLGIPHFSTVSEAVTVTGWRIRR